MELVFIWCLFRFVWVCSSTADLTLSKQIVEFVQCTQSLSVSGINHMTIDVSCCAGAGMDGLLPDNMAPEDHR